MRALITGADGFVGQWLARELLDAGDDVSGTFRGSEPSLTTLPRETATRVRWLPADLSDSQSIDAAISQAAPEVLYHLAAQSSVPAAIADPANTVEVNVLGSVRVLDAARKYAPDAIVIAVGSADAYGAVDEAKLPVREDAPLRPTNPYAASKAAAEIAALQFGRASTLRVIVTRSFNHTGPGQSPSFVAAAFAKQIADIKMNRRPPKISVGNLSARRDLSDVRDVVAAYRLLAQRGAPGRVYNVCSGKATSMGDVLDQLLRIARIDVAIEEDAARMRPVDTPIIVGDPGAIARDTGWQPRIELQQTLTDLYQWFLAI